MVRKSLNDRVASYIRRAKNQELIIKYLRTLRFEFVTYATFVELYPGFKINPVYSRYAFMIRLVDINTKGFPNGYDVRLVLGLKIEGKKSQKVLMYEGGSLTSIIIKPWNKPKNINFKKVTQKMRFDPVMSYKERRTWRNEHEKLKRNPKHTPSKFYTAHQKFVQFL